MSDRKNPDLGGKSKIGQEEITHEVYQLAHNCRESSALSKLVRAIAMLTEAISALHLALFCGYTKRLPGDGVYHVCQGRLVHIPRLPVPYTGIPTYLINKIDGGPKPPPSLHLERNCLGSPRFTAGPSQISFF
jgi:hypothetical protein